MRVLVNTCIWSLALRRQVGEPTPEVAELRQLISDHRVEMAGPIRQELLSGVRRHDQFDALDRHLRAYPDVAIDVDDYVEAARCFNECRTHGIRGSNTDFLLCSLSLRKGFSIFTTDVDFALYARHLPIALHRFSG